MAFTKIVGAGIHTLSNVHTHNINSSGIITATNFVGPLDGTTGDFSGNVTIDGNLTVNGTTTTLDTNLIDVDKIEVTTAGNNVAVAITHNGSGDLVRLYDGSTQVVTVDDEGNVTSTGDLTISSILPRITLNDTNNESDYEIKNENGSFRIRDIDNPTDRYRINSSGTIHEFFGTADFASHLTVDGNLYIADNIIHSSDTNTKIRFPANDTFTVETGGSERLRVDSDGKVTIGIGASANNNVFLTIPRLSGTGSAVRLISLRNDTAPADLDFVKSRSTTYGSYTGAQDDDFVMGINSYIDTGSSLSFRGTYRSIYDTSTGGVHFMWGSGTAASTTGEKMRLTSTGNVGIGSVSPGQKLDVSGNILTRSSTNTAQFQHNALKFQTSGGAHIDHETTNQNLNFRVTKSSTSDTTMVQINAASEQTKFRKIITVGLQGGGDTTQIGGGSGIGAYIQLNYANNNIVNTKLFGNNTSWLNSHYGNLGIGTQTADEKFQVRTGTNNFISFTDAQHGSLSTLGSAIIFSRPQDGAKKICGIFQHTNQSLAIAARDDLTFHTGGDAFYYSGSEALRIKSDGKVGIGTDNPSRELTLYSPDSGSTFVNFTNATTGATNSDGFSVGLSGNEEAKMWNHENTDMQFATHNTMHMNLRETGQLGIGTNFVTPSNAKKLTLKVDSVGDGIWIGNAESLYPAQSTGYSDLRFTFRDYLTGGYTLGGEAIIRGYSESAYATQRRAALIFMTSDNVGAAGTAYEKMRLSSHGRLSFAGDTDTYIHHPEDNEIAITCSGGTIPLFRVGTGGNNATVGIKTDSNLVTNGEALSVRGYSSFKSLNDGYAAIYTHNEEQANSTIASHILFNWSGANRAGFGVDTDNSTLIMGNNQAISFKTGATQLGGTEKIRINSSGMVVFKGGTGNVDQVKIESQGGGTGLYIANFQGVDAGDSSSRLGVGKNDNALIFTNASGSQISNFAIGNTDSIPLVFSTANTKRLVITGSGQLQHQSATGLSYFNGSSEYIFGSTTSSPPAGGPEAKFQVHENKTRATMSLNAYMANAGAPVLQFVSSRSGTKGTLGTKSALNDYHGDIRFMGDNGTNYSTLVQSAQILVRQKSNISDGDTQCAGEMTFHVGNSTNVVEEKVRIDTGGGITLRNTDCHRGLIFIHDGDGGDSCTSMANVQGSGGRGIVETKIYGIAANTTTDLAKSHWGGLAIIGWSGTGHQGTEQVSFGYHRTPTSQYKAVWVGNLTVTYTMSHYTLRISHNASNDLNFWCILIGV